MFAVSTTSISVLNKSVIVLPSELTSSSNISKQQLLSGCEVEAIYPPSF
jgi:hypothetical protein